MRISRVNVVVMPKECEIGKKVEAAPVCHINWEISPLQSPVLEKTLLITYAGALPFPLPYFEYNEVSLNSFNYLTTFKW